MVAVTDCVHRLCIECFEGGAIDELSLRQLAHDPHEAYLWNSRWPLLDLDHLLNRFGGVCFESFHCLALMCVVRLGRQPRVRQLFQTN